MLRVVPFVVALVVGACIGMAPRLASAQGSDAEARALFNAGEIAYSEGRWESALAYFERAYEMSHRPILLFNIGSSAEHLRRDEIALEAFRRYLAEIPDAGNRAAVASRIAILEQVVSAAHASISETTTESEHHDEDGAITDGTAVAIEPTPRVEAPAGRASDLTPWFVAGVGGAVLVAGAVLVGIGYANIASVTNARDGVSLADLSSAHDTAPILTGAGWAAVAVGAAVIAGGVAWGVVNSGTSDSGGTAQMTLWGDDHGGGIVAWGTF